MPSLYVSVMVFLLVVNYLSHAEAGEKDIGANREVQSAGREKRSLPYWNMWSSDFIGWLEELQAQASYDHILDLARTFWAHFPIANGLGYDSPDSDQQPEEN